MAVRIPVVSRIDKQPLEYLHKSFRKLSTVSACRACANASVANVYQKVRLSGMLLGWATSGPAQHWSPSRVTHSGRDRGVAQESGSRTTLQTTQFSRIGMAGAELASRMASKDRVMAVGDFDTLMEAQSSNASRPELS